MVSDSSLQTRITPLVNGIKEDNNRLTYLLNMMMNGYQNKRWKNKEAGTIQAIYYEESELKEKSLPPTTERLIWLVENLKEAIGNKELDPENKTTKRRNELIAGEKRTVLEAKTNILSYDESKSFPHKWWVLEGNSKPKIFILTDKYIFIGDTKESEESLTKTTNMDEDRVQLVREIEGAMKFEKHNYVGGHQREVISFYIFSEEFLGRKGNRDDLNKTMNGDVAMWDKSLKHLSHQSIEEIKETYIGFTTWEDIRETLGFIYSDAKDDVDIEGIV
ncbi:MAG: hypothetical protein ACOH15_09120 [Acetobacterium sp.]